MIITVYLSRSMSGSDIGFPVYATCINMFDGLVSFDSPDHEHANVCHIHKHKTLLVRHSTPNMKLYQIFAVKMGHHFAIFSPQKPGKDSVLCAMTHLRRMQLDFCCGNLVTIPNVLVKH